MVKFGKRKVKEGETTVFAAGRRSGKTIYSMIIGDLTKMNDRLRTWLCVVSLLWCLSAARVFVYNISNNDLKHENKALKAEIEVLKEQKDRLENDARYCIEMEQSIKDSCRPCLEAQGW